jgi:uncharacterized damage-inducible protein DinB
MRGIRTNLTAMAIAFATIAAAPMAALGQESVPPTVAALLRDLAQVEEKLTGLAEAMTAEAWAWRPGQGVRSTGEVVMHIAADNYFLPTPAGVAAPASTGIKPDDYSSVQAYEAQTFAKAEALAAMRASFAHLRAAMEQADEASLKRELSIFGSSMTGLELWVLTTTHLHEHLGQLIAYARSNGVVPPWSG